MNAPVSTPQRDFLTTRQVAARLGVALSTVQLWVETGALPAWKTAGGHRRIPVDAVDSIHIRQQAVLNEATAPQALKVLVVDDDPRQRHLYRRQFAAWKLPLQLLTAAESCAGLLLVGRHAPELIIIDLALPDMDGFKMIRRLKAQPAALRSSIIAVTALSPAEIEAHGGLPAGIRVYPKPDPFAALRPLVESMSKSLVAK